jgi:hypothetical protein
MELIHRLCERDISNRTPSVSKRDLSLENLASKQKLSGFLKSTRRAKATRIDETLVTALVEPAGIEPATSWLQTRRSPS